MLENTLVVFFVVLLPVSYRHLPLSKVSYGLLLAFPIREVFLRVANVHSPHTGRGQRETSVGQRSSMSRIPSWK